jgi:hypothetical protein
LLESLKVIEGSKFNVLIITAVTNPQLEEAAEAKVNGILEPFRSSFPIAQFAASDLVVLRERLAQLGFPEEMISLRGYGNVRNIQLIAAHIIGSQVIVGFYLDSAGHNKVPVKTVGAPEGNPFHHKSAIMNAAIEVMEEKPGRLVETSFVFGGNMVIHRRMFEEVSFDPYITRGEDIDYLINVRLGGYHFFLDKELAIVHLPPPASSHLQEDVIRFIYEKEKLVMAKRQLGLETVFPESLDLYPGAFLHNGLEGHALEVLRERKLPKRIVDNAMSYTQETVPLYFEFRKYWPRLMRALGDDEVVRARMTRKF